MSDPMEDKNKRITNAFNLIGETLEMNNISMEIAIYAMSELIFTMFDCVNSLDKYEKFMDDVKNIHLGQTKQNKE